MFSRVRTIFCAETVQPNGCTYLVTNEGKVYREVKSSKNPKSKYRMTGLGRGNYWYVHRLVCWAFHGKPEEGQEVRHLDGDRLNNLPSNLKWGSRVENCADTVRHGKSPRRLSDSDVKSIKDDEGKYGYRKNLAEKYGVTENHITDIRKGRVKYV